MENIVKTGKKKAEDIMAMPENTEEEKAAKKKAMLAAGGEDKLKKIIADETDYTTRIPPPQEPGHGMADKLPFTKEEFIGKGLRAKQKALEWEQKWAPYYNDDGTKKTAAQIQAEKGETPTPAAPATGTGTETAPAASPGGAGSASAEPAPTTTPPAGGGASSAIPMAPQATGSALPAASSEHAALSMPRPPTDTNPIVNNAQMASTTGDVPEKAPLPAVRNVDSSFRDMIIRSTRVV